MRRVVITGMGCVTPVGNDVPTFWENIKNGKCGIGPITHFDATDYKVKVAAEVKDFDPLQYMEKSDLRKYDVFCWYAMAAATQAVEESGIKDTLLCKMTASACGVPVYAGPVEATVMGNIGVACLALGEIRDHREARKIIRESNDIKVYQPLQWEEWQEAYGDFLKAAGLKG